MRLIDADELIKALDTWDKFGYDEHNRLVRIDNDDNEYVPYVHYEDVIDCIKCIQTVFDLEKVVEELYMHSVEERIPTCLTHRIIDVEEAIEIVKAGGKNG